MTTQMTSIGVYVLCGAIILFWGAIGVLVRAHRTRSGDRPHGTP